MYRRLTPGLAVLRATGFAALVLLVWDPVSSRLVPGGAPPLVLLDASLSMAGHSGRWREALDTARALARGGVIWRFGARVQAFDSTPPADGASRLRPALEAAAARGGVVTVVTDGAVEDRAELPADLLRRARVVLLPRPPFPDAFVASVEGPRRVSAADTIRLRVSYGRAGKRETGDGKPRATLAVELDGRRLTAREVELPDSGTQSTDLTLPASRSPSGWSALGVRLEGVRDSEPRDDARTFVLEVSPQPAVVAVASPPDWDMRFLARTLGEVARVPLRLFVEAEPGEGGAGGFRDGASLAPVSPAELSRAVAAARLVVLGGDPSGFARFRPRGAVLAWPSTTGQPGDWYVQPPPPSPIAGRLAGVAWDSLAPAVALSPLAPDSAGLVALAARLGRTGAPRPVVLLEERDGVRRATVTAAGLYRWAFRGGASAEAYRALVAALADWLLGGGAGGGERAAPVAFETANGLPLAWQWTGAGSPHDLAVALTSPTGERVDTLRFDAGGRAELLLTPGVYRYALRGGPEHGIVAVETYSDEWRPTAPALRAQEGAPAGRLASVGMRDRWWLFALAIAAFAAEWAWRRRQGFP